MIRGLLASNPDWNRTRNDRVHRSRAPVKDVYLYPLVSDFRQELCS